VRATAGALRRSGQVEASAHLDGRRDWLPPHRCLAQRHPACPDTLLAFRTA